MEQIREMRIKVKELGLLLLGIPAITYILGKIG